jgi:hypothetical protein
MCFSATASFSAAAVLSTAGVVAMNRVPKTSQLMFASIPLLFGIQQCTEGMLWISFTDKLNESARNGLAFGFLIFAQVIWPTWVPLAFLFMEENEKRKKILNWLSVAGIFISIVLGSRLLFFGIHVSAVERHIYYDIYSPPQLAVFVSALYIVSVIIPCFISNKRGTYLLGLTLIISLVLTMYFYTIYLISVWCFFAAILSLIIFYVIHYLRKENIDA